MPLSPRANVLLSNQSKVPGEMDDSFTYLWSTLRRVNVAN